ncbi:hypothetical protein [Lederbergia citri]|uniref:Uncharacterized protein n=1 Tax=Lederbergia citri TaxID=2833580 RepID=A0A942TF28_9BACI|nr:hypothetical protein [Lederbergia citri]MBS4195342.1 hypothetical protein [Lederbergia citri]
MEKLETARILADNLRSIYGKFRGIDNILGVDIGEGFSELDNLLYLLTELLYVPPWECDREIVWNYVFKDSEDSWEDVLRKVELAREKFNPDDYEKFCEEYERFYGSHPEGGAYE